MSEVLVNRDETPAGGDKCNARGRASGDQWCASPRTWHRCILRATELSDGRIKRWPCETKGIFLTGSIASRTTVGPKRLGTT